jgi:hypothetical protein
LIFRESLRIIRRQMRKHTRKYLVLAFLAALTSGAFCLGKDDTVSPESLLAQARKLEEIWNDGTPPITMRVEIQILEAKGKVTPGHYVVTWQSSSRWREQLEIANYNRIRVHDAKGYVQVRVGSGCQGNTRALTYRNELQFDRPRQTRNL